MVQQSISKADSRENEMTTTQFWEAAKARHMQVIAEKEKLKKKRKPVRAKKKTSRPVI